MKHLAVLSVLGLLLAAPPLLAETPAYRVGERLPPDKIDGAPNYRQIQWEELIPKGWDPAAAFRGVQLSALNDNDPKAMALLDKIRRAWDEAPVEASFDGQRVRLPGFVIPLERQGDLVSELLLVPYFGACIHSPPPPANQIIHVVLDKPVAGIQTMDTLWLSGRLTIKRSDTGLGTAGYRMQGERTARYTIKQSPRP